MQVTAHEDERREHRREHEPTRQLKIRVYGQIIRVGEAGARVVRLVEIELDHLLALQEATSN